MNELALAIEEVRAELAGASNEILFDVCDIDGPMLVDGGASGDSVSIGSVATNINVSYKGLGTGKTIVVGGEAYTASHQLKMARIATTVAITPRHKIKVRARGNTPLLIFEKPLIDEDSKSPFLVMSAVLVTQGYQQ